MPALLIPLSLDLTFSFADSVVHSSQEHTAFLSSCIRRVQLWQEVLQLDGEVEDWKVFNIFITKYYQWEFITLTHMMAVFHFQLKDRVYIPTAGTQSYMLPHLHIHTHANVHTYIPRLSNTLNQFFSFATFKVCFSWWTHIFYLVIC